MGEQRAGLVLNIGMGGALLFACIISWNGSIAILENLK